MASADFAHVGIIVLLVVTLQRQITTENMYSCLLNRLSWKHIPCVIIIDISLCYINGHPSM